MNANIFWKTLRASRETKKWKVEKGGEIRCATGQCPVVGVVHEILAPLWDLQDALKQLPAYVDRGAIPVEFAVRPLDPVDAENAGNMVNLDEDFVQGIIYASDYPLKEMEDEIHDNVFWRRVAGLRKKIFKELGLPENKL